MSILSPAKRVAANFLEARVAAAQGLETKVFDEWQPELDEALMELPETDIFPHELFRLLMKMSDPTMKQLILVTERGEPVALAGLRNRWGTWEPVTQWIVPGVLFPVKQGYIARVLAALGLEIKVAWWRWETPPPRIRGMRKLQSEPTYGMKLTEDFEYYWSKTGQLRNVRTSRKRCCDFEFRVNSPGTTEWTIKNWSEKWRPQDSVEIPGLAERLFVAKYLEEREMHYTLSLLDRDEPVGALTFIKHNNNIVSHHTYRNSKYDWHRVLIRLWDLTFLWAREMKFDGIDLGGSFDHKKKWAPQKGEKWVFTVCPFHVMFERRVSKLVYKAGEFLNSLLGR